MKNLVVAFCFLLSSLSAMADLRDESCAIAIPTLPTLGGYRWVLPDDVLQILVNQGYEPYRVDWMSDFSGGLRLTWSIFTEDKWYGEKSTYRVSVRKVTSRGDIFLGSGSSSASFKDAIRELPSCIKTAHQ